MKIGFYPKLAISSIRKNRRLYLPYILTCIGMVTMFYIITFLQYSDTISNAPGSNVVISTLNFGSWVVAVFTAFFLFYTNSFLMRRRRTEFGLYNILGMGKRNISRILFWETLIVLALSLAVGIIAGITLSKLAELCLVNVLKADITYSLSIAPNALIMTAAVFSVIFFLIFLNSVCQIKNASAIQLFNSRNTGERPPKANWLLGILGIILLAFAYYIAVNVADPISALAWFFIAVIMVVIGTYLLFIAGSVLLCRILQKNKKYYYKPNHFVSVSSMVFRMKRNGAGLASICILATMVLVMVSSTTSLYFGADDSLNARYPYDFSINLNMKSGENIPEIQDALSKVCNEYESNTEEIISYRTVSASAELKGSTIKTVDLNKENPDISNTYQVYIFQLDEYNRISNKSETLSQNEILLYADRSRYSENTITINNKATYKIKRNLSEFINIGNASMNVLPSMYIIVPQLEDALTELGEPTDFNSDSVMSLNWNYSFNTDAGNKEQTILYHDITDLLGSLNSDEKYGVYSYRCESREANRNDFFNTYGSLLFLGIILSIVFISAAVLIIYYKQISEGYEDQSRFDIMQKVGMTKKEIRKSINSQLLIVFFLPLVFAGCHLAFAFPMIRKLLLLFQLNNVSLFTITTIISFVLFAVFYAVIYRITSNAYYNIVSRKENSSD